MKVKEVQQRDLVSVLMTAYNREEFIEEAIESVLASTYQNFELIIVDDRSTDNTLAIARHYEQKDGRVRVYSNEKNLGDYPNRKYAASLAVGKYLKFVDSDDVLYPHGLEVMVRGMQRFPEAGLGMVWNYTCDDQSPKLYSSREAYYSYFFKNQWLTVGPSGCIYRRDCYEAVGGFDTRPYVSDFDLNLKLAAHWPVTRLQTGLFFYRIHGGQQLGEGQKVSGYPVLNYLIQRRHLDSPVCPLSHDEQLQARKMIDKLQARRAFIHFIKTGKRKDFRLLVEESGLQWGGFRKGILQL